jgi:hypothetical protein
MKVLDLVMIQSMLLTMIAQNVRILKVFAFFNERVCNQIRIATSIITGILIITSISTTIVYSRELLVFANVSTPTYLAFYGNMTFMSILLPLQTGLQNIWIIQRVYRVAYRRKKQSVQKHYNKIRVNLVIQIVLDWIVGILYGTVIVQETKSAEIAAPVVFALLSIHVVSLSRMWSDIQQMFKESIVVRDIKNQPNPIPQPKEVDTTKLVENRSKQPDSTDIHSTTTKKLLF